MDSWSASTSSSVPRRSRRGRHWGARRGGGASRYRATESRSTWMVKSRWRAAEEPPLEAEAVQGPCLIDNLSEDLLEKILAHLPVASLLRVSSVCKRWREILKSRKFFWTFSRVMYREPWYFMFNSDGTEEGYTYDPVLDRWYGGIDLPFVELSSWVMASCCGLVCFMDNDRQNRIYVCNPVTRRWRGLGKPLGTTFSLYSSVALTVDRKAKELGYSVVVTKSTQLPGDFAEWDFSISVYDSQRAKWSMSLEQNFHGWRGGEQSVVCNGFLYCMVHVSGILSSPGIRHAVIFHDLSPGKSPTGASLLETMVRAPCPLTCARLMNLKERLILVGGLGRQDLSDAIKGVRIWELIDNKWWQEISRMPPKIFQALGNGDDVFASSGHHHLVYIQAYGSSSLLVFDISRKEWKWAPKIKCYAKRSFHVQLYAAVSFEPRIDISP